MKCPACSPERDYTQYQTENDLKPDPPNVNHSERERKTKLMNTVSTCADARDYNPRVSRLTRTHSILLKFKDRDGETTTAFRDFAELANILHQQADITVIHKITVTRYNEHSFRMS